MFKFVTRKTVSLVFFSALIVAFLVLHILKPSLKGSAHSTSAVSQVIHPLLIPKVKSDIQQRYSLGPISSRVDMLRQDVPLPKDEEQRYFAEIEQVFLSDLPSAEDSSVHLQKVIRLNERYRSGVRSCLNELRRQIETREQAMRHIAIVDYIAYRLKWDSRLQADVVSYVSEPAKADLSIKAQAAQIADKLEIMSALVTHRWEYAKQAIAMTKDAWMARKLATRAYATRIEQGQQKENVYGDIVVVLPSFLPPT